MGKLHRPGRSADRVGVGGVWEPHSAQGGPDGLEQVLVQSFRIYRRHMALLTAINEVSGYDRGFREFWATQLRPFAQNVTKWLEVEQRAGRTRADLDLAAASELIVIGGERFIYAWVIEHSADTDQAAARELALTWWYGIYRRPAAE